ncbi:hypothetical protein GCM10009754_46340 [Amycolatopsis minnesotensis]|uniref:Uncharacterized protein n=1 Tax=Amycolatopsis minnesotensis TaxID=337894 RepID=A0ABP5CSP4_9PSEU
MVAELVEFVDVEARLLRVQPRAHFLGEDPVAESLCGKDFIGVARDEQGVAGSVRRKLRTRLISADE